MEICEIRMLLAEQCVLGFIDVLVMTENLYAEAISAISNKIKP
jgi:hypothetical protein